jgi:holo-[acyl-carrier protein] synthase
MRIYGIGIDVIEVERIEEAVAEFGDRFLERIFTASEREYCSRQKRPELHYAARWAAKEAVSKALGTGIGAELAWTDVEVLRAASGEPSLLLHGLGKAFAEREKVREIKISLTHAKSYAAANAVALGE